MKVLIFGANGRVGSLVVEEALSRGHLVTAFVRGNTTLGVSQSLKIINGDVTNSHDVKQAMTNVDAVVSALGSWGTTSKDILTKGMANIIPAMQEQGVKRIISLTGADALIKDESAGIVGSLSHAMFGIVAGRVLQDGEQHIKLLEASKLDWTVLRSPVMSDKGTADNYLLSTKKPLPWHKICRKSVAKAMVDLVSDDCYNQQAPFIRRAS